MNRQRRVKIVCTLGPATPSLDAIRRLAIAGMNVARLNFSHGEPESHREVFNHVRQVAREIGRPIAILMDLQGPKIRVRRFADERVQLVAGEPFLLTTRDILGDQTQVSVSFQELPQTVSVDEVILLDDGLLAMRVERIAGEDICCRVTRGGTLSNRKGINLPGSKVPIQSLTEKDQKDLAFALALGADYVALSFVQTAQDIIDLKELMRASGKEIPVVAKIEKPQAVERIEEIIAVTDVIMLARGDLGVEMAVEKVPPIQKRITKLCNRAGMPVITATQMLESMVHVPRPTRAKASNITNTILDKTDTMILSAETTIKKYPNVTIETISRIVKLIERHNEHGSHPRRRGEHNAPQPLAQAVAYATCQAAEMVDAEAIVAFTYSGQTPLRVAQVRPQVPILAVTSREAAYHRLALVWGVQAFLVDELHGDAAHAAQTILAHLRDANFLTAGKHAVITAGVPFESRRATNMCMVDEVPRTLPA